MSKITKRFLLLNLFLIISVLSFVAPSKVLAFSPTDISGMQLRLDASTGVYQDTGKTTNATYNVVDWADQSGNGHDATSTISNYPFIATTATSSVYFQSNGTLQSSWGILTGNAARSIVVVFSLTSSANQTLLSWGTNSSSQLSQIGIFSSAIGFTAFANDLTTSVTPYTDGKLHVLVVSFDGATMNLYIDNVLKGTASKTLNTGSSNLFLGQSATGSDNFTGSASEILIYNQGVSSTDAGNLYTYLSTKWGTNTTISAPTYSSASISISPVPATLNKPVPVIVDTDIATDQGDVGALAEIFGLQQLNEATILAIVTNSDNIYSAPTVKAITNWYGYSTSTIPIGAFQGTVAGGSSFSNDGTWPQTIVSLFGTSGDTRSNYPSALTVYRQTLAAAQDNSVVIDSIGFLNNLRDLLQSPADGISSLTGQQLVTQKVRRLVVMGGDYPIASVCEWNFCGDTVAASYVMANWPTEIVATGFSQNGGPVGPASSRDGTTDPVKKAYDLTGATTLAWDQVASLYAVRGLTTALTIGGVSALNVTNSISGINYVLPQTNGLFNFLGYSSATSTLDTNIQALMNNLPITVSSINTSSIGPTSATITWTTSSSTDSQVEYGTSNSYGSLTTLDSTHTTSHSVTISGLSQTTTYHFAVMSTNGSGSSVISSDRTFTTTDATPPTVSVTAPTNGATVSGSTVTVSADASDNDTVAGVKFYYDDTNLIGSEDVSSPYAVTWDSTGVADGSHTLSAVARDNTGNVATSSSVTVTVHNAVSTPVSSGGGFSAPYPTAPAGGFTATRDITNSQNKIVLHFGLGMTSPILLFLTIQISLLQHT